jgi:hypothetical protein
MAGDGWCEIVAMVSSFAISIFFVFRHRSGTALGTDRLFYCG